MRRNAMHPARQDFRVAMPPSTHRIPATCREVDCPHFLDGWMTVVAVGSRQDIYIRHDNSRKWTVQMKEGSTTILEFIFEPGQTCFREHTRLSGRPPFYLHETADGRRLHRAQDFIEHVHEETDRHFAERA